MLEQLERYEEALASAIARRRRSRGADVWHWYNQGNVLALLGRYDEALPALQNAIDANPKHARSWARLGNVLRQLKRYDEALDAYERATDARTELRLGVERAGDHAGSARTHTTRRCKPTAAPAKPPRTMRSTSSGRRTC